MITTNKDFRLVTIIGVVVGALVLVPAANLGVSVTLPIALASIVGFGVFAALALFVLKLLAKRMPIFEQFGKFAAVGTLNTLLNLAVLNACIAITGIAKGLPYSGFVVIAFFVATTNSYFWNKFWTFQSTQPLSAAEYGRFALFTLCGALLNVGAATLVVNVIGAPASISANLWANVGGLAGVAVSFLWNFISYRRIVFRSQPQTLNPISNA
jgi:putative flippase GtrA